MKRSIEITPEQLLKAVNEANESEPIRKLTEQNPVIKLAFTVFGMQLTKVLFNEEVNNE